MNVTTEELLQIIGDQQVQLRLIQTTVVRLQADNDRLEAENAKLRTAKSLADA